MSIISQAIATGRSQDFSRKDSIPCDQCLVAVFTYNNGYDLEATLKKFGRNFPYRVVVHVDGSVDGSDKCLESFPFPVLRNEENAGIGRSIKNTIKYAVDNGIRVFALIAGNNKNDPQELCRLIEPVRLGEADYVQGSRFLPGSRRDHTPFFRLVMVKIYSLFISFMTGVRCTDALEGVRAYKLSILEDPRINIWQDWLDTYEFESYLHYKVLKSGYAYREVQISKIYPNDKRKLLRNRKGRKYSHIRPVLDWWRIVRPIFFLLIGIRK
jgi:dolichol-phosphate mannosyltransferase